MQILLQSLTLLILMITEHAQQRYLLIVFLFTIILRKITLIFLENNDLKTSFEILLGIIYLQLISITTYGSVLGNITIITITGILGIFSFFYLWKFMNPNKMLQYKIKIPNNFTSSDIEIITDYVIKLIEEMEEKNCGKIITKIQKAKDLNEITQKVERKINEIKLQKSVD